MLRDRKLGSFVANDYMDARYIEALEDIRITGKLNQSTEQHLKDAINEVLQQFNAQL